MLSSSSNYAWRAYRSEDLVQTWALCKSTQHTCFLLQMFYSNIESNVLDNKILDNIMYKQVERERI